MRSAYRTPFKSLSSFGDEMCVQVDKHTQPVYTIQSIYPLQTKKVQTFKETPEDTYAPDCRG